jgi:hypothetical protein
MIETIYCDESGFTGTNLSDKDQPVFVYTSIALNPQRAHELVSQVIRDFRLQATELKGSKLVKSERGRNALSFLLEECVKASQSVIYDKKYALACKLFEYIMEPALSEKNWIFYNLKFQKFVSTLLYAELCLKNASAEELFTTFEELMRSRSAENLESLFAKRTPRRRGRSVAKELVTFWYAQQDAVGEELTTIKSMGAVGKWTLDLTDSALFSLLCYWGQKIEQLDVFCDDSKPLFAYLDSRNSLFAAMVGRKDRQFITVANQRHCVTFNLSRPITLANSKTTPGIQVADAVAASIVFALQNRAHPTAKEWLSKFDSSSAINSACMIPDADDADVSTLEGARNRALFFELVKRCREGKNLLENIEDFITFGWIGLRRYHRGPRRVS